MVKGWVKWKNYRPFPPVKLHNQSFYNRVNITDITADRKAESFKFCKLYFKYNQQLSHPPSSPPQPPERIKKPSGRMGVKDASILLSSTCTIILVFFIFPAHSSGRKKNWFLYCFYHRRSFPKFFKLCCNSSVKIMLGLSSC